MHYPINIEMLMGMAQTAGISDLSKKLLGQMARVLNNIYKMGMEYSTEDFVFTPEIVREAHQRVYGKLLVNEEVNQRFYELLSEWGNDAFQAGACSDKHIVRLSNISMSRRNSGSRPTKKKMEQARRFYEKYGVYKREIVIDEHGVLMDGYTTYLLMCEQGKDMVPVRRIKRQGITAVFNEGGKAYQWEIPLKLIDKIAPGDRVVVETFYGPQQVTVKEIIPLAKRTGRKVRRIGEKPN